MAYEITDELIIEIARCGAKGLSIRATERKIKVGKGTLTYWLNAGKTAETGEKKKLWEAWEYGRNRFIYKAADAVITRATDFTTTKIKETEKLDREGNVHLLIETTKEGPDAHLALKLLEKFDGNWRPQNEPRKDTDPRPDTGNESTDGKTPLARQIEGLKEAFEELDKE